MLREKLASPTGRCFLNTSTAECVKVDIPEFHDHDLLALTPEGLLVLVHKRQHANVCLLNPLTHHLTQLPPLTTLVPPKDHDQLSEPDHLFSSYFAAWGSGIAFDDSAVVLCFNRSCMLGVAKPGDDRWMVLNYEDRGATFAPLMFAGRFYCIDVSARRVMVLETGPDQTLRFELAAEMDIRVSTFVHTVHLINNFGELMLVHRHRAPLTAGNKSGWRYDAYQVDLDTRTLIRVDNLGGRAVFMGMSCSLSVSLEVFPSGSIKADTIYLSFDVGERWERKVEAYHLPDGRIERAVRYWGGLVPRPYTLIDCLALSNTAREVIPGLFP
uniref:Uncharacterized protein n=1 Tax=Avena sativa TaxID=4498 RepID=A0ACD5XK39_AVESA